MDLFSVIAVVVVSVYLFGYLALISYYLPRKPVGRYWKHGFELIALVAAFVTQWYWGCDFMNPLHYTAFNTLFHAIFRLQRHPLDLGWLDWFVEEAMQVAIYVFGCGGNMHFAIANLVAWIILIGCRFCLYAYPQVSDYQPLLAT